MTPLHLVSGRLTSRLTPSVLAHLQILIFIDVFRYRIWNPDVQWAAKEIVRLVHESRRICGSYVFGWMMPVVIAGTCFWRPEDRDSVRKALQYYRPLSCFTIEAAWATLEKVSQTRLATLPAFVPGILLADRPLGATPWSLFAGLGAPRRRG